MANILNRDYVGVYNQGVDRAEQRMANRNALARQQREQALMKDPNTTPEQFARAGMTGIAGSLGNIEAARAASGESVNKRMFTALQYARRSTDPKAFIRSNLPQLAAANANFENETPEQILQGIDQGIAHYGSLLGVGPEAQRGASAMYKHYDDSGNVIYGDAGAVAGRRAYVGDESPGKQYSRMSTDEIAAAGLPVGTVAQIDSNGQIKVISKPDAGPGSKPPTESEKRARVMYRSMQNAENQLREVTTSDTSDLGQAILGKVSPGKILQSQDYKRYEAAGLRWAANLLYLKSGATATESEIRNTWLQYFPQPGDGAEVKAQKDTARAQELEAINESYSFEAPRSGNVPRPPNGKETAAERAKRLGL